jgi:type II secretory pathway component PulL
MPNAVTPTVGLVFLPGADLPEVNRLEGHDMVESTPDQKDAIWRVNTAATLLSVIFLGRDLALVTHDVTSDLADRTIMRMRQNYVPDQRHKTDFNALRRDAVTIDSELVKIHQQNVDYENDICATLVEVNVSSLVALMYDYQFIVSNSGPALTHQETKDLLDR